MDLNNDLLSNDTEYSLLVVLYLHGGRFRMLSGPEIIKKKQKSLYILKTISLSFLILIPLTINFLNRMHFKPWQITICVAVIGSLILILHRMQTKHKTDIDRACHQLGPGVKLVGKFKKSNHDKYQIFQEGHRYYYLQHMQTGEKRLVAKEKILQDFDLAL